ncbi:unnamed protein product [Ectocarpus sp. 8 AP-2014]
MPCITSSRFYLWGALLFSFFCSQGYGQVELPALPYGESDLEPYITAETVGFHYGAHHQGYVNNMNAFIEADPELEGLSLWKLMKQTEGTIFNNAAQIYNHNLYWNSLSPSGGGMPTGDLYTAILAAFGSYEDFQTAFTDLASGHFGSGWAWLMMHEDGSVDVVDSHDASNPVSEGLGFPLLVCDVWEHAYYLDYQNLRASYIEGWWALVNWDYAESEYTRVLNKYNNNRKN